MTRTFLAALALLVIGDIAYFAALKLPNAPSVIAVSIWVVLGIAAFVASWLAPKRRFIAGLAVAVPAAILLGASTYIFEAMGNAVDFAGFRGSLFVLAMSLPVLGLLCAVGAFAGLLASKRWANA